MNIVEDRHLAIEVSLVVLRLQFRRVLAPVVKGLSVRHALLFADFTQALPVRDQIADLVEESLSEDRCDHGSQHPIERFELLHEFALGYLHAVADAVQDVADVHLESARVRYYDSGLSLLHHAVDLFQMVSDAGM